MKVVNVSRKKINPTPRNIGNRRNEQKYIQGPQTSFVMPEKIKLPELDPVLTQVIDYKSPLLLKEQQAQTQRPEVNEITVKQHVTFRCATTVQKQRPQSTIQATKKRARRAWDEDLPIQTSKLPAMAPHMIAATKPLGKRTAFKAHIDEKVENIYYTRSQNAKTPMTEMRPVSQISTTRRVPDLLIAKERTFGLCLT